MPEGLLDLEAWREALLRVLEQDRGGDEPGGQPARAEGRHAEVLGVEVGGEQYGFEIGTVAEILLPRPVTPVPRTPRWVLGIASVRGTVLPVVDLAVRLGLAPRPPGRHNRIVVVRDGEERMGFRVDRVRGVVRLQREGVEGGDYAEAVDPRFLKGVGYDREGRLLALLCASALCDFRVEGP